MSGTEIASAAVQTFVQEPIKHAVNVGSMGTVAAVGPTGIEIATIIVGFLVSGSIFISKVLEIRKTCIETERLKAEMAQVGRRKSDK
jgi:hypothetical protein